MAYFEENVRNLKGNTSAIDLLWKGKLIVEHKSRGEDLSLAATQAFTYIEDLTTASGSRPRLGRTPGLPANGEAPATKSI